MTAVYGGRACDGALLFPRPALALLDLRGREVRTAPHTQLPWMFARCDSTVRGDRILGGGGFGHDGDVGLRLQKHPDAGPDHRVVVDEEHGRALAHGPSRASPG